MRIGILTQSMAANYGCNLQAFALQTILKRFGADVQILDRWDSPKKETCVDRITKFCIQNFKDVLKVILGKSVYRSIEPRQQIFFWQNFIKFQKQYLCLSPKLFSSEMLQQYAEQNNFDTYIVGSDQVWRPAYNVGDKLYNMFFDFTDGLNVKRISYAASFGVDMWEFSEEQTQRCRKLIQYFDAISVRENTGVGLCREYLGVNALHVLDPTLLLSKEDYDKLIANSDVTNSSGNMFCYILDSSELIKNEIKNIEKKTNYKSFTCLPLIPENTYNPFRKKESILPSVEQWLKSFADAEIVIADSFHGMVFSIIYNKPFWVVGNTQRGTSRFSSLLKVLGLENRLVSISDLNKININSKIDWDSVNQIIAKMKWNSLSFLENALTNESSTN